MVKGGSRGGGRDGKSRSQKISPLSLLLSLVLRLLWKKKKEKRKKQKNAPQRATSALELFHFILFDFILFYFCRNAFHIYFRPFFSLALSLLLFGSLSLVSTSRYVVRTLSGCRPSDRLMYGRNGRTDGRDQDSLSSYCCDMESWMRQDPLNFPSVYQSDCLLLRPFLSFSISLPLYPVTFVVFYFLFFILVYFFILSFSYWLARDWLTFTLSFDLSPMTLVAASILQRPWRHLMALFEMTHPLLTSQSIKSTLN